jgi:hypothetical protein
VIPTESERSSRSAGKTSELTALDLALLAEKAPEAYRELLAERRNWRRLAWAETLQQILGHVSGLAALVILAAISWHAIDRGDATQGASIICTGAVSIVAVFVTGRLIGSRTPARSDEIVKETHSPDSRTRG